MRRLTIVALMVGLESVLSASQATSDEAFMKTVTLYVALHRSAASGLPTATATDPATAQSLEAALAQRIQALRPNAGSGDILGPAAERIRTIIRAEVTGPQGHAMLSSIEDTNVHGVRLRANHRYPPGLPRVTMPAQLLAKLPTLPPELEYRFLGRSLVLIDTRAGLVVDALPDVLPPHR